MINEKLIRPESIAVLGASNNITKPGGKLLKNLIDNRYPGRLYAVNPRETEVQGLKSFAAVADLPDVDLAVLAIPAQFCPEAVEELATRKNTGAFIVVSAGFSEAGEMGRLWEQQMAQTADRAGATLIGPNCIGIMTPYHTSVFTTPIPPLWPQGCDFISGSGATAVFILESGIPKGLRFSSVWSVGNSAQTGVEEVLQYFDESYDPESSSKVKLLYLETIRNPDKLLFHASSLIQK
ncbi:MAG TPA: CoA-binding protein, partial [Prolixibacteraceae bacterium]|nr:CoA-binding protein [Prolixibacteraceae bacterium]